MKHGQLVRIGNQFGRVDTIDGVNHRLTVKLFNQVLLLADEAEAILAILPASDLVDLSPCDSGGAA